MRILLLTLLVAFLAVIPAGCGNADDPAAARAITSPLVLDESSEQFNVGLHMDVLEDPTGTLTIDDVSSPAYAPQFRPTPVANPNFGFTPAAVWLRLPIVNKSEHAVWYLASTRDTVDLAELYQPQPDGTYRVTRAGYDVPFSEWSTRLRGWLGMHHRFIIDYGDEQTLYLRLASQGRVNARLAFMTEVGAQQSDSLGQALIVTLIWIFLILLLYNLLLGVWQKDADLLLLAAVIMSTLMRVIVGTVDRVIWPTVAGYYDVLNPITIALYAITFLLFADRALGLRGRAPLVHRVFVALLVVFVLTLFAALAGDRRLVTMVQFALIPVGFAMVAAITLWRGLRGDRSARLFFFALLPAMALILYELVPSFRFPLPYAVGEGLSGYGMAASALLFSIVLAERVADSRRRAEDAGLQLDRERARYVAVLDNLTEGVSRFFPDGRIDYVNKAFCDFNGGTPEMFTGHNLFEVMKPQSVTAIQAALARLSPESPTLTVEGPAIDYQGEHRWRLWSFRALYDADGTVLEYLGTGLDITEQHRLDEELRRYREGLEELVEQRTAELEISNQALQRLNQDLREQTHVNDSLRQMAYVLNSSLDTQSVLESILAQVRRVRPADSAVRILFREGSRLVVVASAGDDDTPQREVSFSLDEPRWPGVLAYQTRRIVVEPDLLVGRKAWVGASAFPHWRSVLAIPLCIRDDCQGVMIFANERPGAFAPADVDMLRAFAEHAGLAIANARLYEASKTLAAATERDRIARDLHDSVTQTLFSASLLAEVLPVQIATDAAEAAAGARRLNMLARGALGEMRMLLVELRPATLLLTDLETLLTNLVSAAAARSGIDVRFRQVGASGTDLPPDVRIAFYRIAQEALNNVVKHSGAASAEVRLSKDDQEIMLIIHDDGCGFDQTLANGNGIGQSIMRERARDIDAAIEVNSTPGQGTTVMLVWERS